MSLPAYPEYKDSGRPWLGQVPAHWEVCRLRFKALVSPSKAQTASLPKETEVSFLPMETVSEDGTLNLSRTRLLGDVETGYTYFADGDVLYAKVTPCFENGKGAHVQGLTNGIGFGSTELTALRPGQECDGKFLFYFTRCTGFVQEGVSHMYGTGGLQRVPDDFAANFTTAFPPLHEQQAIAAWLDERTGRIDEAVAAQRTLLEQLKEKRRALIAHAVTRGLDPAAPLKDSGIEWLGQVPAHWEVSKMGRVVDLLSGFAFPSAGFCEEQDAIKLLRGINVGVGSLRWDETVFWKRQPNDGLDAYELRAGDLVVGMDRPLISEGMRVATVKEDDLPCLLLQRVVSITAHEEADPRYILAMLSSEIFISHFAPETTGVSVPHISPEQIRSFPIPLPPLHEQQAIAAYLDTETAKLDTLAAETEATIALLQEHRTALIAEAVTGKIRVPGA